MTIPFKAIPSNIRVPLFYAEVDNSRANTGQTNHRALLIGQITAAGTATPNVPVISQGLGDARTAGGPNSMLALMAQVYRLNDSFGELWYLPLADAVGATAATGSITVTSAPTASGTLALYVGAYVNASGVVAGRYQVPVTSTMAVADVAAAIAAAIAADAYCPVTASAAAGVVTLTAVNKGPAGNDIDIRLNYGGAPAGEVTPAGLAVTIAAMTGGATAPDLTTALANLGDQPFDCIVCPYTDTVTLNALQSLLSDATGRWSYASQVYGHVFAAARGTLGTLTTLGTARNDQHATILGFDDSPTANWLWAAAVAGAAAVSLRDDPALPLQTVTVAGVLAPPLASRFDLTERNTLLYDGISTFTVSDAGTVAIENLITTYQKNAFGNADNSYLEVETMFTLAFVLRDLKTLVTSKYSRVKLAANGTRFAPGSAIVTPNTIRADLISRYDQLEYAGYVQNSAAFAQGLVVEQNATNPNRVDVLWPGTLIDQLRVFALLAQFRLQ